MLLFYGISIAIWLILMEVGSTQSWEIFNISKAKNFISVISICLITLLLVKIFQYAVKPKDMFNIQGLIWIPFETAFFYFVYIFIHKHKEHNPKEINRWNLIALLGCLIMAFFSSTIS